MKKPLIAPLAVGAALAFFSASTEAALLLHYTFEDAVATDGSVIDNIVGAQDGLLDFGAVPGTVSTVDGQTAPAGGSVAGGNLGRSLSLTPATGGDDALQAPNIDTGFSLAALGISTSTPYTTMAWVNFASTAGDNMIFGQGAGDVLHLGTRDGTYHSGHWAGDTTGGGNSGTGTFQHVAFTNDTTGLQKIYVNGVEVHQGGNGVGGGIDNNQLQNLLIGTSRNNGGFSGLIDEVKVYNETLDAAGITAAAAIVPEPSSIALLALASAGVGLIRRRRN